ncbi:MAG: ATP-binding protein, partial [Candidatus Micrarchaeota archaeon]|nr:ATP-binding protein [Candidatus Micrarchaeota archaeon]
MPEKSSSRKGKGEPGKPNISFKAKKQQPGQERQIYSHTPMFFYWSKDVIKAFISQKNFPDALAVVFASASVAIAFPFFPVLILIPLLLITFIITLYSPLLGLMALLFETLPMFIYQTPLLAWIMIIFMSFGLFIAHKHYRSITFVYALIVLPMSYLGAYLEIPAFILGILYIGFRRAVVATVLVLLLVAMLSGMTGIQNSAPILYDASGAAHALGSSVSQYTMPSKPAPTIGNFIGVIYPTISQFFNFNVSSELFNGFGLAISAMFYDSEILAIQIVVWLLVVFAMTNYVIKSRSGLKGTESSFFCLIILGVYVFLSYLTNVQSNVQVLGGFVATPLMVFILEYNNIEVVKSLSVMKQDFLGNFGEAFQDLASGTRETLKDIANYEQTKEEVRQAVIAPIEHREISGAYNVKPARGILLFGPPGTGKTLLMRALANEIRAKFFYVKTSSIISPFQGESSQMLSKIFSTVKRNSPAVLFFDELDGIASNRESQESDSSRQLLSTLLSEMDGFQNIEGVVIVGSTNAPQILDPAIMRPGRFDKIIYMPLPDKAGRAKIFKYYLDKLPVSESIPYAKLADATARYSGADIKN